MHLLELLPEYNTLTAKEQQLLQYVVVGNTNAEIAELEAKPYGKPAIKTIEANLQVLYAKLNVKNRKDLFVKLLNLAK